MAPNRHGVRLDSKASSQEQGLSDDEDSEDGDIADLVGSLSGLGLREELRRLMNLLGRHEEEFVLSCPSGHRLENIPVRLLALCDCCKHVFLSGVSVWRCATCNWTKCESCSERSVAEAVASLRFAADAKRHSVSSTVVIRDVKLAETLEDALAGMTVVFAAEFKNFLFDVDSPAALACSASTPQCETSMLGKEWDDGAGDSSCSVSGTGLMPLTSMARTSARLSENSTAAPSSDAGCAMDDLEASWQPRLSVTFETEATDDSQQWTASDSSQLSEGARQERLNLVGLGPLNSLLPADSNGELGPSGDLLSPGRSARNFTVDSYETGTSGKTRLLTREQTVPLASISDDEKEEEVVDPRACIADFLRARRRRVSTTSGKTSEWFAVYRPTSNDAIAKMVDGTGVGKGLNVKGKSSKQNRFSGFVPFLQISENAHKTEIEASPATAWIRIFYRSEDDRRLALRELEPLLHVGLAGDEEMVIFAIDDYPDFFGLMMPERVMREAYIMKPDLSFPAGWETGRKSEPAFMDMNLHATRGSSEPQVVVYQADDGNPMNPHGLLIAYAEATVKPVVSDFDAFTVGSRGKLYPKLCKEQQDLSNWVLDKTKDVLKTPGADNWTARWFEVLGSLAEAGIQIDSPRCGFGDAASYALTEDIVDATKDTGAVRHGAECFNFFFPQELDTEYLVVWDGFPDRPWEYRSEPDLRAFLIERACEGFAFPLNPVWPVRDPGWYEVHRALRGPRRDDAALDAWYPPESGISAKLEAIHAEFPDGFRVDLAAHHASEVCAHLHGDMCCTERVDFAIDAVRRKHAKAKMRVFTKTVSRLMVVGRHRGQAMALGMQPALPLQPSQPKPMEDKPGMYRTVVTCSIAEGPKFGAEIARLQAGIFVQVLEVLKLDEEDRVRGRIAIPKECKVGGLVQDEGWISLSRPSDGFLMATPQVLAETQQAEAPLHRQKTRRSTMRILAQKPLEVTAEEEDEDKDEDASFSVVVD